VQSPPARQAVQVPPLHTSSPAVPFVSQAVPSTAGVEESTHSCVPVAQEWVPTRHSSGFAAQVPPARQTTQAPPLHTSSPAVPFVSQAVPFATGVAVSTHCCVPVAQEVVPARHASGFVAQERPAVQATHVPLLQT
jgi:hypothetical protein